MKQSLGTCRGDLRTAPLQEESFTLCFCPWSRSLCGWVGVQLNCCWCCSAMPLRATSASSTSPLAHSPPSSHRSCVPGQPGCGEGDPRKPVSRVPMRADAAQSLQQDLTMVAAPSSPGRRRSVGQTGALQGTGSGCASHPTEIQEPDASTQGTCSAGNFHCVFRQPNAWFRAVSFISKGLRSRSPTR